MKVNKQLSDRELKLICLNITGGFQTSAVKALWDHTQSDKCDFCGAVDNHAHRMLHCPDFAHIRSNHPQAIQLLEKHQHLMWFPLATECAYHRFKLMRAGPFLDPDTSLNADRQVIYTDGTCDRPCSQNCCRAA